MDLAADDASDEPPEKNWNTLCVTRIKFRFIRLPKRRELRASPEPILCGPRLGPRRETAAASRTTKSGQWRRSGGPLGVPDCADDPGVAGRVLARSELLGYGPSSLVLPSNQIFGDHGTYP